jgi:hypothetical protein
LIEGSGVFNNQQQLIITFHSLDASLAYFIKKKIGFGSVKKLKDENGFLLIISSNKSIEKVIKLIYLKLITSCLCLLGCHPLIWQKQPLSEDFFFCL